MRFCEAPECKPYPVFSTDKLTGKGYCRSHATKYRTDLDRRSIIQRAIDKQKSVNTKVRSLHSLPENKTMINKRTNFYDVELELYFMSAATELAKHPYCQECNTWIPTEYFRDATAHILLKSKFPSVKYNPYNRLFLGAGCGCHEKSHRLDTFSKMKVWPEAVRKFRLFENDITEHHKLLNTFKELANQLNTNIE